MLYLNCGAVYSQVTSNKYYKKHMYGRVWEKDEEFVIKKQLLNWIIVILNWII